MGAFCLVIRVMNAIDQILWGLLGNLAGPFFFVGSGKNAGKTTLLNRVNRVLAGRGRRVGITTIGHDGEPFDAILGHLKPPVEAHAENLVCLTERMAAAAGDALSVLCDAGHETAVGKLVLSRCLRDVNVEILGPETNAKCLNVCEKLEGLGAEIILVDGAFHRRTQIAVRDRTSLAVIISADLADGLDDIETFARHTARVFGLPRVPDSFGKWPKDLGATEVKNGKAVAVTGPLTSDLAAGLTKTLAGRPLFLEDATKIFCEPDGFARLAEKSGGVFVGRTFDLTLIAANPTARQKRGFDPGSFAETLKKGASEIPVLDVVSEIAL